MHTRAQRRSTGSSPSSRVSTTSKTCLSRERKRTCSAFRTAWPAESSTRTPLAGDVVGYLEDSKASRCLDSPSGLRDLAPPLCLRQRLALPCSARTPRRDPRAGRKALNTTARVFRPALPGPRHEAFHRSRLRVILVPARTPQRRFEPGNAAGPPSFPSRILSLGSPDARLPSGSSSS